MKQNRKMLSANFSSEAPSEFPTLFSLSEQAQNFLARARDSNSKVRFVLEFDGDGTLSSRVEADPALLEFAKTLELQFRGGLTADGYNIRKVDFSKIHAVQGDDLGKLADAMEIPDGGQALDLMCGYGAVSAHILEKARAEGRSVKLSMCDLHRVQLDRIPDQVRAEAADVTIGDARNLPYGDGRFDAVVIKMGVHEVPHIDQPLIFQEVFRVLKPGGRFVMWDVMPETGEHQDAFMEQIQKKNALAGYESIVVDRYFSRGEQIPWLFEEAGFTGLELVFMAKFQESTLARLDSELGGDRSKLEALNEFTRRCTPEAIRAAVDYQDDGESIAMKIPNRIFRAIRPE